MSSIAAQNDHSEASALSKQVDTPVERFDRKSKVAPDYLYRLRNKGYWRAWNYVTGGASYQDSNGRIDPDGPWRFNRSSALHEAQFAPKGVLVDAGCGFSADANIAREKLGYTKAYKIDLFPIDCDNQFFDRDMKKSDKRNDIVFIQGDICDPQPIPDSSVDLIVCSAMLDLVPQEDRPLFYEQAYRMLKPGGQLSIYLVHLANGWGFDLPTERDKCITSGFELERNVGTGFIVQKPRQQARGTDLPTERPNTNNRPVGGANDAPKKEGTL